MLKLCIYDMYEKSIHRNLESDIFPSTIQCVSDFRKPPVAGSWLASPVKNTHEHVLPGHVQASSDSMVVTSHTMTRDNHWVASNAGKNVVRMVDGFWGCMIQSVSACYLIIVAHYEFTQKLASTELSRMFHVLSPSSSVYLSAKKMDCTAMTQWSSPVGRG